MNKRKLEVALIFALLAIIVFWASGYLKRGGGLENALPDEGDILTMRATWFNPEGAYEFTVEPKYFSDILGWLQPAQRYRGPYKGHNIVFLRLYCKDEKTVDVQVFFGEMDLGLCYIKTEDPAFYYYRGGNGSSFPTFLSEVCRTSKDKRKVFDEN